jgi:uncharacterized protein (DUF305 family)
MSGLNVSAARLSPLLLLAALTSCSRATQTVAAGPSADVPIVLPVQVHSDSASRARARADSALRPYTQADIDFFRGMISHHSQAIIMARWAPSHGASPGLQTLAGRIINAQMDEIVLMQQWLADRGQDVPPPRPMPMKMVMDGMEHEMMMPGMLTDAQMQELDAARGKEFDRLFLTFMMQHHRGAVTMVQQLFGTPGAAADQTAFKLASDVQVDQTTEIARMERMLASLFPAAPTQ